MSDDKAGRPTRAARPTPNPASRARRIGGRPAPGPRPGPGPTAAGGTRDAAAVTLDKRPTAAADDAPLATDDAPLAAAEAAALAPRPLRAAGPVRAVRIAAVLLGIVAAALLAVLAVVSHGVYWAKPSASAGARNAQQEQVLAAAKKCFATINTYDYRKLSGLLAKDLPCTTGAFRNDLRTALQRTIVPAAPKAKAVQTAQVNRAGVVSVSQDGQQWVTLIYGQLVQTNTSTGATPRTDLFGAVVTLDRVGGQWLISKVGYDTGNSLGG